MDGESTNALLLVSLLVERRPMPYTEVLKVRTWSVAIAS